MKQLDELTSVIGKKRFITLAILCCLNLAALGIWQKWFVPEHERVTREKQSLESTNQRLNAEILELPTKYAKLKANEDRFELLKQKGFFLDQDRIGARQKLDQLRVEAGLRGISYGIDPQETITVDESYMLTDHLVKSTMKIDMKGLTDIELRDFIGKVTHDFSGLVVLRSLALNREDALDAENLRKLGEQNPVDFVTGNAVFDWYAMLPVANDPNALNQQAFGGQTP